MGAVRAGRGRQIEDRSLVWNTDLIETLELQNCLDNAMITMCAAPCTPSTGRGCWIDSLARR